MTADLTTTVTGTRSDCVPVKAERKWNANGTRMERKWNANGTRMERKWNANGTHLRTRSGRVPNAFSVRLFLSSTVNVSIINYEILLCNTSTQRETPHLMQLLSFE